MGWLKARREAKEEFRIAQEGNDLFRRARDLERTEGIDATVAAFREYLNYMETHSPQSIAGQGEYLRDAAYILQRLSQDDLCRRAANLYYYLPPDTGWSGRTRSVIHPELWSHVTNKAYTDTPEGRTERETEEYAAQLKDFEKVERAEKLRFKAEQERMATLVAAGLCVTCEGRGSTTISSISRYSSYDLGRYGSELNSYIARGERGPRPRLRKYSGTDVKLTKVECSSCGGTGKAPKP